MRNLWFCLLGCTLIAPARAQTYPAEVAVNVTFRDTAHDGQNLNLPKLFFKNTPLDVIRDDTLPLAPLHVVFVLDSDTHQRTLMKTSLDYAASLAAAIHSSQPRFTVVAAGRQPKVLAEADTSSQIQAAIRGLDPGSEDYGGLPGSLYAGVLHGISLLENSSGLRTIVIVADNDDDVTSAALDKLRRQMAANHIRCFSILLANHDFSGSKARARAGIDLEKLSTSSGGLQFWTDWQNRQKDYKAIDKAAQKIDRGSLITFRLPGAFRSKPGFYTFEAQPADGGKTVKTNPILIGSLSGH